MQVTLQQHVTQRHGESLGRLFAAIAAAALRIEGRIRTAPLFDALGAAGQTNVQGEQQQKLDVFANDALLDAMRAETSVAAVVSEEEDQPTVFEGKLFAEFVVLFDPLDGSSNIDVNVNTGTIVSIQRLLPGVPAFAAALQPGAAQVAALYVDYGPATVLVYTAGDGTHSFTLHDGTFLLNPENVAMPAKGSYYSVNEGNFAEFPQSYRDFLNGLRSGSLLGTRYSARYIGSFIADFHRTLLKGGIFLYPPTAKAPNGKLRLLYEANPLAFIAEQAGGAATTGATEPGTVPQRILGIVPREFHERTTLVIGSRVEVEALTHLLSVELPKE